MKNRIMILVFPLVIISTLGILLQRLYFLPGDIGFLTYLAKFLPLGATYGKDYLETNPPLILYFYYPVWIITQLTSLSVVIAIKSYIYTCLIVMMILNYYILQKIIRENIILCLVFSMLLVVTFIMPVHTFGQREQLFFALTLPYFFSVVLRLDGQLLHPMIALLIGVAAGIGFNFKPFFFAPAMLVELYLMLQIRSLWTWIRIETLIIALVSIIYLWSILTFHPAYIDFMLPLVSKLYFVGVHDSLNELFFMPNMFFIYAVGLIYVFYKSSQYNTLSQVLMLVLIGDVITYLFGQTSWYYHVLPAVSTACLLLSLYFSEWIYVGLAGVLTGGQLLLRGIFYLGAMSLSFFIPFHYTYLIASYHAAQRDHGPLIEITHYLQAKSGTHSVMCFSLNTTNDCFPLVYETNSIYGTRYPFFWWFRGLVRLNDKYPPSDKEYLLGTVAEDIHHYKPRWIIVDASIPHYLYGKTFYFQNYFRQNKRFNVEWKAYHLEKIIKDYEVYQRG